VKKGEIWYVDLSDGKGHEQKGERPAIVLGGANDIVVVVPLTTNTMRATFSFTILIEASMETGLREDSIALVFQITSLDKQRLVKKWGRLGKEQIDAVDALVKDLLNVG